MSVVEEAQSRMERLDRETMRRLRENFAESLSLPIEELRRREIAALAELLSDTPPRTCGWCGGQVPDD